MAFAQHLGHLRLQNYRGYVCDGRERGCSTKKNRIGALLWQTSTSQIRYNLESIQ